MENETTVTGVGVFEALLKRNNKQIRDDRAQQIITNTELKYRRRIEDLVMSMRDLKDDQDGALDLSPSNSLSLVVASDFPVDEFIDKDIELSLKIRNERIKLEEAIARYAYLFGKLPTGIIIDSTVKAE